MPELSHRCVFAGAGGTCTGIRACGGFRSVFAVEWGAHRVRSLRNNHHDLTVEHRDVTQLDTANLTALLPRKRGRARPVDFLTASPPCESFTSSRNRPRHEADGRDMLYRDVLRVADRARARVMLWENVQELAKKETDTGSGARVIDLVRRDLAAARYHIFSRASCTPGTTAYPSVGRGTGYWQVGSGSNRSRLGRPRRSGG